MDKNGAIKDRHLLFHNGIVVLPDRTVQDGFMLCRDGLIQAVGRWTGIRHYRG